MRSLIAWVGGKSRLAKTLVALLPEHRCYVEAFGGAGWVLFAKESAWNEVYNDLDGRLVALFRSVKHHPQELTRELDLLVPSRELWDGFHGQPGLTEIQRAARFLYLLKLSYGAKAGTFASGPAHKKRFVLERILAVMDDVRERLGTTTIERMDFAELIERYDTPQTAFFCDPPYVGSEGEYAVRFSARDHERLCEALAGVEGKWLLTYNDCEWVRDAYADHVAYRVRSDYSVASGDWTPGKQLIVSNYEPGKAALDAAPKHLRRAW